MTHTFSSRFSLEYGSLRDASIPSCCSSTNSIDRGQWSPPPNQKDDLYSWMANQNNRENKKSTTKEHPIEMKRPVSPPRPQFGTSMMQDSSVRLLDAHLIFEPILTCLGVMPQQMVNNIANGDISSLDSLGTNLSLVGSFDIMRIDIVVSETGDKKLKSRPNARKGRNSLENSVATIWNVLHFCPFYCSIQPMANSI